MKILMEDGKLINKDGYLGYYDFNNLPDRYKKAIEDAHSGKNLGKRYSSVAEFFKEMGIEINENIRKQTTERSY